MIIIMTMMIDNMMERGRRNIAMIILLLYFIII